MKEYVLYFCSFIPQHILLNMAKTEINIPTFHPDSPESWRQWLLENHRSAVAVWLVYYKKKAGKPSLSWSEAVDEALCFGWIDSKAKPLDDEKYMQFFTPRKAKSVWSKINKEKIKQLEAAGKMTPAGWEIIEIAQQNGSWTILDEVEELVIPDDLAAAFVPYPEAWARFLALSKSVRKTYLYLLVSAKRPETRQKRIEDIVAKMMA